MSRAVRLRLAEIAAQQIGNHESGGNNAGEAVRRYQRATWEPVGSWPWCAAFVAWCVSQWLSDASTTAAVTGGALSEQWRCKDASAYGWETWARHHGLPVLPMVGEAADGTEVRIGDLVTFDFSHIGIVSRDQQHGDREIATIEGNTQQGAGAVRDSVGDGVWRRLRPIHLVRRSIRLVG